MQKNAMRLLYFIPARSGSKGIKDKNIRFFFGKPLLSYAVRACLDSQYKGRVLVSTDSESYASIARQHGAEVPFLRPRPLSGDTAKVSDAILDALEQYKKLGTSFDAVVLVQPTSPLILAEDVSSITDFFLKKEANAVVSVAEADCPREWLNHLPPDFSVTDFLDHTTALKNRQELPVSYRITGCVRAIQTGYFIDSGSNWYGPGCYAVLLPRERSVDIDSEFDWKFAEFLMSERHNVSF